MKILTFSFAGGNKYSFKEFSQNLAHFNVIEYPGRGMRLNEALQLNIDSLIEDLLPKVINKIEECQEYIIYGHSMGALIGYMICQRIQELGLLLPVKLVISGKKPPAIKRESQLSHLSDNLFWEEVVKLGGVPDDLMNYKELIEFYTPILKADFTAIENYNYVKKEKLSVPIDVFYGSEEQITEEEIIGWRDETNGPVTLTRLKGNHFFIFNHIDFFTNYFRSQTQKSSN
ncbi:thioesterase II family protein [Flavobacterium sp. N502540]|uniref:thioesterase II family protein n=1 Tax=Flavobacterium sp. N502540 TaxID=2986838 RepID=UPI002224268C|nr:thioesterase domain-containing protein [Flavobacterium sp. N502540]